MTVPKFRPILDHLFAAHGEVEISHVRVFAQLCSLEHGSQIAPILRMPNFFPLKLTVTIRHHDWWGWENDNLLHIGSDWVEHCRVPNSLREVCVEIESLQRKKNQIDWIANEMVKKWHFKKIDGKIMSATSESCQVSTWSGSSTWEGERWLRDETKPGVNEYYVKTITWRPNENRAKRPRPRHLHVPNSFPVITNNHVTSIRVSRLERAGIPGGLPADETLEQLEEWEARDPDLEVGNPWDIQEPDDGGHEDDQEAIHSSISNEDDHEEPTELGQVDCQAMTQTAFEEMLEQSEDEGGNDDGGEVAPIDQDMTQDTSEEHSEHSERVGSSHHPDDNPVESIHEFPNQDGQNLGHHDGSEDDGDDDGGDYDYSDSNMHDDDDDDYDGESDGYWQAGTDELAHSDEEFEEEESGNGD